MTAKKDTTRTTSLMENYSTENASEFLAKALAVERGQKQLIKKLYQDREEIVDGCPEELALQIFLKPAFLSCLEGRKLAAYFLVNSLGCEQPWTSIKRQISAGKGDKALCGHWGEVMLYAWNIAEVNPMNVEGVGKNAIETEIIQDLFFHAVMLNRKYAQKFSMIVDGLVGEDGPNKKQSYMLFRCLMPIIWRNLEAPNEDVRLAASSMLLRMYPLKAEDDFVDAEYRQRQNNAMQDMLMDPCVPIRIEAIKKTLLHFCNHWQDFPRQYIKQCLDTIVDCLSQDEVTEVRAAVYEGMELLLPCASALTATQHSLEILAPRGINDKTEKVRLAAFKLLNKLKGHRFIKYFNVVEMDDVLRRLDFEHSGAVQGQIVQLVFKSFCPRLIDGIDYIERYKRIRYMNRVSRNASLNFHRLIYPVGLVDIEQAVRHMRSLLIGVKAVMKKNSVSDDMDVSDAEGELKLDVSHATTLLNAQQDDGREKTLDEKMLLSKNVLDSAIVLWVSIRHTLYTSGSKYARDNSEVIRSMASMLQTLDNHLGSPLTDSALVIASYLPKEKVGRVFSKVLSTIQKGELNEIYFAHYVEAFASWDMDKLIEIILKGLKTIRNVVTKASGIVVPVTPCKDSPPNKRKKASTDEGGGQLRRPLEFIMMLLASPNCSGNLQAKFGIHLVEFCKILTIIRNALGKLLKTNDWKALDMNTLIGSYETLAILSLIVAKNRDSRAEMDDSDDAEELSENDRVLVEQIEWMGDILAAKLPPANAVRTFLRCASLHMDSGVVARPVLDQLRQLLEGLKEMIEDSCDRRVLEEAIASTEKHLDEALKFCEAP